MKPFKPPGRPTSRYAKQDSGRAALAAKIQIRNNVLQAIAEPKVFDAFAGHGEMYNHVWCKAKSYTGCDLKWHRDQRLAYVADNRRVMRSIDLRAYNIFDLDAYGSPWDQLLILAASRPLQPQERIGIVITEGTALAMHHSAPGAKQGSRQNHGGLPKGLGQAAGLKLRIAGVWKWREDVIERGLHNIVSQMRATIERRWEAKGRTESQVSYLGLVLCGE